MPKSSSPRLDDSADGRTVSDVALRKKKNALAQSAFRARRAAYISCLENTVTNLESIVLSLQDSSREARNEVQELRQENARLKLELREREKFWRAIWPRKTTGQGSDIDLPPPPPFSFHGQMTPQSYSSEDLSYRSNDGPAMCNGQFNTQTHEYHSSLPYPTGGEGDDTTSQNLNQRLSKYTPYFHSVHGSREGTWPPSITQSSSSESGAPPGNSQPSHSPPFAESPHLPSPDMSFVQRFSVEDQKMPMANDPYVFSASRSVSPSSTSPSTSATSLNSFPFTFAEQSANDRSEYDYRRQSYPHSPEVTLHGGTADISGISGDGVRYRLGGRRPASGTGHPLLPVLPPLSTAGSHHERGSSDDSGTSSHFDPRRTAPSRSSRSPSPGSAPPLSGTLAVIKAQAFGALRRTRARPKKSSDNGVKVGVDVLDSRDGGGSAKRPRLDDDDDDDDKPNSR